MSRPFRSNRRGITSMLAMLFLVLMGTLALGFYSTVTTSTQLAGNDRRTAKALLAAESGLQFMRFQLARVDIPPNTTAANLLNELYTDLVNSDGTGDSPADHIFGNLTSGATVVKSGNTITIPAEADKMIVTNAAENAGFRISITDTGTVGEIVCTVTGMCGSEKVSTKGVRLDFSRQPHQTDLFDNAVASKGRLVMKKGAVLGVPGISDDTIANIMSARSSLNSLYVSGGTIGGNVGVVDTKDNATITGGNVHGSSNLTTIYTNHLKVVAAPDFPIVDTTVFSPYATNTYSGTGGGNSKLTNLRIPPNTNPVFDGNRTIEGILYVESPNVVEFSGNATLAGFIVFENAGTPSDNQLKITGNFSVGNLPADNQFDPLRTITGVAVVAPTTAMSITGNADSQLRGNVIIGTFRNTGNANIQIDKGSLIAMEETGDAVVFDGKNVRFTATGKDNQPSTAVYYSEKFTPSNGSYLELN